jgi:hypothetical protein
MLAPDFCSTAHLEADVVVPFLFLKGKSLARSRTPKLHPSNLGLTLSLSQNELRDQLHVYKGNGSHVSNLITISQSFFTDTEYGLVPLRQRLSQCFHTLIWLLPTNTQSLFSFLFVCLQSTEHLSTQSNV